MHCATEGTTATALVGDFFKICKTSHPIVHVFLPCASSVFFDFVLVVDDNAAAAEAEAFVALSCLL